MNPTLDVLKYDDGSDGPTYYFCEPDGDLPDLKTRTLVCSIKHSKPRLGGVVQEDITMIFDENYYKIADGSWSYIDANGQKVLDDKSFKTDFNAIRSGRKIELGMVFSMGELNENTIGDKGIDGIRKDGNRFEADPNTMIVMWSASFMPLA